MKINEYLKLHKNVVTIKTYVYRERTPHIVCADGFSMSVQVGDGIYCEPRTNDADFYNSVEIGYPSEREELIMEYCEEPDNPTGTVYGYVPVAVVKAVIEKHGGIANAPMPNPLASISDEEREGIANHFRETFQSIWNNRE